MGGGSGGNYHGHNPGCLNGTRQAGQYLSTERWAVGVWGVYYAGPGRIDWLDLPGVSGQIYAAELDFRFTSYLANDMTGDACATNWAFHLSVAGGEWQNTSGMGARF